MTKNNQRLKEILGTSITEYTPNAIKFTGISLKQLEQLLAEDFTTEEAYFNAAPTTAQFIEFGSRCAEIGAVATFDGIAFIDEDGDTRMDTITVVGVKDLDFAGEFVKFTRGCDDIEVSSHQLFAWWD
ncbi:hypothetical protein RIVM261_086820 [Rivularia sp. IAM M-261]|nr:hypothetical protein RIVM261_086820 [Rivularia sp. IAM M-261]